MNRKIVILYFCLMLAPGLKLYAQNVNEKPYINVSGSAEREVVPDEIYITVTLIERYEGRDKVDIETQERQMVDKLKGCGVTSADIALSTADEAYRKAKVFHNDVMAKKKYQLKVSSADMAGKVLDALEDMKIRDAAISRLDYSKRNELKKELLIEAVKAAKSKAEYMLEAIGQRAGKPLLITEDANNNYTANVFAGEKAMRMYNSSTEMTTSEGGTIDFRKIRYRYSVNTRFEIN